MNEAFEQEYTALARMLKWESFRFVPVGHNRKSIYTDIASRIYSDFPDRNVQELRLGGKSYREIIDTIQQMDHGILLIPDFDWLLRKENDSVRAGFNQRRDLLAQLKIAFVCFIEPATYPQLPKKLPDWWSLRSLELDFKSDPYVRYNPLQTNDDPRNSLDIELKRLMIQLESTNQSEKLLLQSLYMNIAALLQGLNEYKDSIKYSQLGLEISLEINDIKSQINFLLAIGKNYIYSNDYNDAIFYLSESMRISKEVGNLDGEAKTLNNLAVVAQSQGDRSYALTLLNESLQISQILEDKEGEASSLLNISFLYKELGELDTALTYIQKSLSMQKEIGNRTQEVILLNNLSQIYMAKGEYSLGLDYMLESLEKAKQTGNLNLQGAVLNNIGDYYNSSRNYDSSMKYLLASLEINKNTLNKKGQAANIAGIGNVQKSKGLYEEAIKCYIASANLSNSINESGNEAAILYNIGVIYYENLNNVNESIKALLKSFKIFQSISSEEGGASADYLSKIMDKIGDVRFGEIVGELLHKDQS